MTLTKDEERALRNEIQRRNNDAAPRVVLEWAYPKKASEEQRYRLVYTGTKYQVQKQSPESPVQWEALEQGLGLIMLGLAFEAWLKLDEDGGSV